MNRYRLGLAAIAVLIATAIAVTLLHSPMPPVPASANDAGLLPAAERPAAPDFTGIDAWLNTSPLSLPALHGRVVLVDFWTFSCVNCVRTIPHLQALYATYRSRGLVIVGVHSPEFDFEKVRANVAAAVGRLHVTWPVAVDSEMATWNAYGNRYWPAEYLVDQEGRVAYEHFGEGDYEQTAAAISSLLGVSAHTGPAPTAVPTDITPELYAGSERGQLADGEAYGGAGNAVTYPDPGPPRSHDLIQVTGTWTDTGQYLQAGSAGHVRLDFHADSVFVVAGTAGQPLHVIVTIDGNPVAPASSGSALTGSGFTVVAQDLYALAAQEPGGYHLIDLAVPAGFRLYSFTFG
jgi:thiol-disulfide isomerase/thioredoxin